MDIALVIDKLLFPLCRLVLVMCGGLLLAGLLESLHWTKMVARLAVPLARMGHQRAVAAAAFALAFFSPATANGLLAEAHATGKMTRRELIFANLFNSTPTFLVHLPTLFSMVFAFLGTRAFVYMGLTFAAAALRTVCTVVAGRFFLPAQPTEANEPPNEREDKSFREVGAAVWKRFKKRIGKLLKYTIPIYCLFFALQQAGVFGVAEKWLADHAGWFSFLDPKSMGIIAMYLLAESGAAFSAAAALANNSALAPQEIILALLVGNIISTPMRAIRHQLPSYAGYFSPSVGAMLVLMNQASRAASLILVAALYYWYAFMP